MNRFCLSALALAVMLPTQVPANPFEGVVEVDLLPGWRTQDGTHMAGLQVTLAPGWHTYWRAPGDAGIPPSFDWAGSRNITGVGLHWPVPEMIYQNGMRSIGYKNSVVIPLEFALADPGAVATVEGEVLLGVCDEICIPFSLQFSADLPAAGARDGTIAAALLDRPRTSAEAAVGQVTCVLSPNSDGMGIEARIDMPAVGPSEIVVIEAGDDHVWVSEPDSWREGGALVAQADMIHVTGGAFALQRQDIRITVFGQGMSVDIQGCSAG